MPYPVGPIRPSVQKLHIRNIYYPLSTHTQYCMSVFPHTYYYLSETVHIGYTILVTQTPNNCCETHYSLVNVAYLEQIATELFFIAKYSENIQGFQKKSLQEYNWGNIFKTAFEADLPFKGVGLNR